MGIPVNVKKLNPNAIIPTLGSEQAAGCDLYSCFKEEEIRIKPHTTVKIPTGLAFEIPRGIFGAIFARSGLATKEGLRPANCVGVCDSDYRGEYIVPMHNDTDEVMTIASGERIAQLIVMPFVGIEFNIVDELTETKRGDGGFGSTGSI